MFNQLESPRSHASSWKFDTQAKVTRQKSNEDEVSTFDSFLLLCCRTGEDFFLCIFYIIYFHSWTLIISNKNRDFPLYNLISNSLNSFTTSISKYLILMVISTGILTFLHEYLFGCWHRCITRTCICLKKQYQYFKKVDKFNSLTPADLLVASMAAEPLKQSAQATDPPWLWKRSISDPPKGLITNRE